MFERFDTKTVTNAIPCDVQSVCLFATWTESTVLNPADISFITQLAANYDRVVVCTNERHIANAHEVSGLKVSWLVTRQNAMRDFGLWFRVLEHLPALPHVRRIALVNDSCQVVAALEPTIVRMRATGAELWGMTHNIQGHPHLQSYFLEFCGTRALRELIAWTQNFNFDTLVNLGVRDVVERFEIGLGLMCSERGIALHVAFPTGLLRSFSGPLSRKEHDNVSWHHWDRLLLMGCPFLKKKREHFSNEAGFLAHFDAATRRIAEAATSETDCIVLVSRRISSPQRRVKCVEFGPQMLNGINASEETVCVLHDGTTVLFEADIRAAVAQHLAKRGAVRYVSPSALGTEVFVATLGQVRRAQTERPSSASWHALLGDAAY